MAADGSMTVTKNTGQIEVNATLQVGGVDGTSTGYFIARLKRNDVAVGEPKGVIITGASDSKEIKIEHLFESLAENDVITVEFGLDAAGRRVHCLSH